MNRFCLIHAVARARAVEAVRSAPDGWEVRLKEPTRSLESNAKMWAMLTEVSQQVNWYGQKLKPEEWKDVLSASLKQQKAVPGIDGGFVILGARTSQMSKKDMAEMIELITAFGNQQGVKFSDEWTR